MGDWRAPVEANIFEASGVPVVEETDGRTSAPLVAEMNEEQRTRVMRGEVCVNCMSRFPERPSRSSVLNIMTEPFCRPFAVDDALARTRILDGRCPNCGVPATVGFAQGMEVNKQFADEHLRTDPSGVEQR